MNFPENLLFSKEHIWLKVEGNIGTIGITEFAQSELGEIVFVELPNNLLMQLLLFAKLWLYCLVRISGQFNHKVYSIQIH